jgi:hypothetical protein
MPGGEAIPAQSVPTLFEPDDWSSTRSTEGFLAESTRAVRIRSTGDCHRYEFLGLGGLYVDLGRRLVRADADVPATALTELLLGPGLLLPLATLGVFALHASAIRHDGRVFLLCGVSGSGKSSFARLATDLGAEALADDIAPCAIGRETRLRPRFPQLKWAQPMAVDDRSEPIDGVVFVERGAQPLALTPTSQVESRLRLIRHTVAARLFPAALLAAHLDAATAMARSVATWRLQWPECSPDALPDQVAAALTELANA